MPVIVFFKTRESGCILIIETGMCSGITITCKHRGMNIKFWGLWFHLRYSCLLSLFLKQCILTCYWLLLAAGVCQPSSQRLPHLYVSLCSIGHTLSLCLVALFRGTFPACQWQQELLEGRGLGIISVLELLVFSTCLLIWDRITELKQNCLGNGRTSFFPSGKCCEITEEDN